MKSSPKANKNKNNNNNNLSKISHTSVAGKNAGTTKYLKVIELLS